MKASWNLFLGAAVLGAGLSLTFGAPLGSVLAGVALAALVNWRVVRGGGRVPSSLAGK